VDVGIADAAKRLAETPEAGGQVFDGVSSFRIAEQWQQLADAAGRDARIVTAAGNTIEHAWKSLAQRMELCTKQPVRRNDFKHIRPLRLRASQECNAGAAFFSKPVNTWRGAGRV
jgi:hypothetical protein